MSSKAQLHSVVSGTGTPVLLLHGLFGMGSNLGGIARALASRYEVHQLDLPNHGRSAWIPQMDIASLAWAVAHYCDERGIGKSALVGHSLGGKVAMQYALTSPERVSALVVADIAPVAYAPTHDAVFAAIAAVTAAPPANRREAAQLLRANLKQEDVVQFLLLSLHRGASGSYEWRFNAAGLRAQYAEVLAALDPGRYEGPVLFIYGAESVYVREEGIAAARERFPRAVFEALAGTGHWLHVEKPEEFNASVRAFLDSALPGSTIGDSGP